MESIPQHVNIFTAAKMLGVSEPRVYQLIQEKKLRNFEIKGIKVIIVQDIIDYVNLKEVPLKNEK